MTREITHRARGDPSKHDTVRIINQYEFKFKVGKGQHGEVYRAEDSTMGYMPVVSLSLPPAYRSRPHCGTFACARRLSNAFVGRTRTTA